MVRLRPICRYLSFVIWYFNRSFKIFLDFTKQIRWILEISFFQPYCDLLIRGCSIIVWTGLNIKIDIVQKVYEWPSWYFTKMIFQSWDHFGKMTARSLVYFLNYAYLTKILYLYLKLAFILSNLCWMTLYICKKYKDTLCPFARAILLMAFLSSLCG